MSEDNVEPTYDDLADTITANLRTMKTVGVRLDAVANAMNSLLLIIGIYLIVTGVRMVLNGTR